MTTTYMYNWEFPRFWVPIPYLMPGKCPDFQAGKLHLCTICTIMTTRACISINKNQHFREPLLLHSRRKLLRLGYERIQS